MLRIAPILLIAMLASVAASAEALDVCVGDCDGNGAVGIDELLTGVNIALGAVVATRCSSFDVDVDGDVAINEILGGVRSALDGCVVPEPTPTATAKEPTPTATPEEPTPTPEDFVAAPSDFGCLTRWERVRHFRIANPLGHLDAALAVARGEASQPYPVGTIIQLVPVEAMVKRAPGFFPDAHDWEFFVLGVSTAGTEIKQRGRGEVVNIGSSCFACHGAAPQTDFVCESGNGCVPLDLSDALIDFLQNADPRCAPSP